MKPYTLDDLIYEPHTPSVTVLNLAETHDGEIRLSDDEIDEEESDDDLDFDYITLGGD